MTSPTVIRRNQTTGTDDEHFPGAQFCQRNLVAPEKLCWYDKRGKRAPYVTIRPLPTFVYTTDGPGEELLPWRYSDGDDESLTPWLHGVYMTNGYGGLVIPIGNPDAAEQVNWRASPAHRLREGLLSAKEAMRPLARYAGLLEGGDGRGAVIGSVRKHYLVQCLVFEHGGQIRQPAFGLADNDRRVRCLLLSPAAGQRLTEVLDRERAEGGEGLQRFVYHDPVALDSGRFIRIFPDQSPPGDAPERIRQEAEELKRARTAQRGQEGYNMYLPKTFAGRSAALTPAEQALVLERLRDWSQVLKFPTFEQQAALIARSGTVPPEVLLECWADHPDWLAYVRDAGNGDAGATYGRGHASPSARQRVDATIADDEDDFETQATQTFSGRGAASQPAPTSADYDDEDAAATPPPAGTVAALDDDEEAPPTASRTMRRPSAAAAPATPRRARQTDAAVPSGVFDARPQAQTKMQPTRDSIAAAMRRKRKA